MSKLTRDDLLDAADACETYAEWMVEHVERHYEAGEESKGDDCQREADRFRALADKLRDPDEEERDDD